MAQQKTKKFPPKKPDNSHIVKMPPKRDWSDLQKDIFRDINKGTDHTVVIARAGSGKTSTIVEGFKYIPKGKKTLMVAFNKAIADELKQRAASYIDVMTLHSLGFRAIKQSFGEVVLENNKCSSLVSKIIGDDYDLWELNMSICKCVSLCKGFLVDTPDKIGDLIDKFGIEIFELSRKKFIEHVIKALSMCKASKQVIDFDDMIWFPFVYHLNVGKFDVVFVDEAQDLNAAQIVMVMSACKPGGRIIAVGDPAQCVDENTIIHAAGKDITIKNCTIGDGVLCFNNGKISYNKIVNKQKSSWTYGYEIETKSGKKLLMSPNHRIWASATDLESKYIVYLMYRKDLGFRIGKTNKWKDSQNPFGRRTLSEGADKLWILDIVNSNEDALLLETQYSLKYGIPTCVFNGTNRGINQQRLDQIFNQFGDNGFHLLEDKQLKMYYPHWIASSDLRSNRKLVRVNAHSNKGTQVTFEWKDNYIDSIFEKNNISFTVGKNSRIRKYFNKYTDAMQFAKKLQFLLGASINERLSFNNERPNLLTASSLHVGMKVYSIDSDYITSNKLVGDEIISICKKDGVFWDLEVEDSSNFLGNGILSHNSIYQFRGADSEAIPNFINKLSAKTLPLSITYRCPKSIVKLAQEIVPDINAAESAPEGTVTDIQINELQKLAKPGDFVLSRTNAPLIKHCMAFLKAGIPANIQGRDIGSNLLYFIKKSKAKTINSFISYVNEWQKQEIDRLVSEKKDTGVCVDKAECLLNLCEGCLTIKDLKETIEKLFNDVDDNKKVIFSTTHKAKGMERDRVFLLAYTYRYGPGVEGEEANLWYVAVTRSKSELFLVYKAGKSCPGMSKDKLWDLMQR